MVTSDNIVQFAKAGRGEPGVRETVAGCRSVAERALPTLTNGLFDKLDDTLYELADKSESNQLQTVYFKAMRIVRKRRRGIHERFVAAVLADFDRFWRDGPRSLLPDVERVGDEMDFSLVDNEELEENLAVSNLVSKGESRYQRELFLLNRSFGFLVGREDVESGSNPLGPAGVCHNFRVALADLDVEIPVRLVIYKLFDRHVMNHLGGVYEEIAGLLGRSGLVPKTAPRIKRSDSAPTARVSSPASGTNGRAGEDAGARSQASTYPPPVTGREETSGESFATLQQLLGAYRLSAGVGAVPLAQGLAVVATPELLGVLSELQRSGLQTVSRIAEELTAPADLRTRVVEQLHLDAEQDAGRVLSRADEDTLDVISMLFDILLESKNVPDAIKALISRLQIPMLKVAILDKTFFSRKQHPARRLLNSLAQAAVGWTDDGDRSENSLYGRIESVVNRVVAGYGDDPGLFDELDAEFNAYVERERRGAEIAEERTRQVTRGKEQLKVAKAAVGAEIQRRLRAHPRMPLVVREMLEEGWKDVLLLTYLRQGPESRAWGEQLEIADRLVWSVEPKAAYEDRQELLRSIPDVLRSLRDGLNGISFDQHGMARMFKELQACHIACLRGAQTAAPSLPAASPIHGAAKAGTGPAMETVPEEPILHDDFTDMAENLALGDWLELQEENERQARIKLAWKSDVSDAYVFVNRKGVKVMEMTMAGLARLLREGSAHLLRDVDVPIMDHALDLMVDTLRSSGAASA